MVGMPFKTLIQLFLTTVDDWLWKVSFFRIKNKLQAIQVISAEKRLRFSELDRIPDVLWTRRDRKYIPQETKKLLFETKSRDLSEHERWIKLRIIITRSRYVLGLAECFVNCCDDSEISAYSGWQKDEIELLIDHSESASVAISTPAFCALLNHPRINSYVDHALSNKRFDLVNRLVAALAKAMKAL
jgi:hypothetical protein